MMINVRELEQEEETASAHALFSLLTGLIFVSLVSTMIYSNFSSMNLERIYDYVDLYGTLQNITVIGIAFYSYYWPYLIIAAMILLVAMIGAILLTLKSSKEK